MARKGALTTEQKAIVGALLGYEVPVRIICEIFGVSDETVYREKRKNPDFVEKCGEAKKEAEDKALLSVEEWVMQNGKMCISLLGKIMREFLARDLSEVGIRDLAGLFKIMREAFVPKTNDVGTDDKPLKIEFVEVDHSENRDK